MCFELALKCAVILQMMYPERKYSLGQDEKRPDGWNHIFVLEKINGQEPFIIDPSLGLMGKISQTKGKEWDNDQTEYKFSQEAEIGELLDSQSAFTETRKVLKNEDGVPESLVLPLIAPRYFKTDLEGTSNFLPFGLTLGFRSQISHFQ